MVKQYLKALNGRDSVGSLFARLTKNGHGQIALTNMEELDEMEKELALYKFKLEMEKGERSILEEGTISSEDLKTELGI